MGHCEVCRDDDRSFACHYCGGTYCATHRRPENHDCRRAPRPWADRPPDGEWSAADAGGRISPRGKAGLRRLGQLAGVAALAVVLAVAFGPLQASAVVPGPAGERIDAALAGTGVANSGGTDYGDSDEGNAGVERGLLPDRDLDRRAIERYVHAYVNAERRERGLAPLSADPRLRAIARYHSRDMATTGYVGHTAPDGETVADRYARFGYDCRAGSAGGENVARTWAFVTVDVDEAPRTYTSERELARGIVDRWMDSPRHRATILRPAWRREGIGVAVTRIDGKVAVYVTQNLC